MEREPLTPRQEEIVARCSILKAFLEPTYKYSPDTWLSTVTMEAVPTLQRMEEKFGHRNLFELGMWPEIVNFSLAGLFSLEMPYKDKLGTILAIAAMGYQIDDMDDARLMQSEILGILFDSELIRPPQDDSKQEIASDMVWGLLAIGVHWSHSGLNALPAPKEQEPKVSPKPDAPDIAADDPYLNPFNEFMNKSDKFKDPPGNN